MVKVDFLVGLLKVNCQLEIPSVFFWGSQPPYLHDLFLRVPPKLLDFLAPASQTCAPNMWNNSEEIISEASPAKSFDYSIMFSWFTIERERDVLNGNEIHKSVRFWANYSDPSRGHRSGLVRECPPKALNSGLGIIVICPDKIKLINLSFSHLFCLCGVLPQVLSSIGWSIIQNGSGISRSGWNIVGFRLHFGGISKKIYGHTARRKWIWKST